MQRYLNLAVIQMPLSPETGANVQYLEDKIDRLMEGDKRPDLVTGVEFGVAPAEPEPAGGQVMDRLAGIASRHGIYLIPGSMKMSGENGGFYNAAPVFNPRGELVDTYYKMVPWDTSLEKGTIPGQKYVVFDIPEKNTRAGVQICFDADFPEISRTQALMGAEILVQLSMDPDSIPLRYNSVKIARAIENQAYYVYTNGTGDYESVHLRGHSTVIDPEGNILYEAGELPSFPVLTLDLDKVKQCREYGNWHQVNILQAFFNYRPRQPYANREEESPLFQKYYRR